MSKEDISQEFRLKNIEETRNFFIKEIDQKEFMSKKHKQGSMTQIYIKHYLILPSAVTGFVSISAFASSVGTPIGITSSAIGLKICAITAGIKNYNSIIKKKKSKHDKTVLLPKSKWNSIEVLIFELFLDSNIRYEKFALINMS